MEFTIRGFGAAREEVPEIAAVEEARQPAAPRKSLVQVRFPDRNMTLGYYNDRFDLKAGDRVYVDGKLEGVLGRVTEVSHNFRIRRSDYQKVIAVVDTDVSGRFHVAGSHFVTFDPGVLPVEQVKLWFSAPVEEEEIVSCADDSSFLLDDLRGMEVSDAIARRGRGYYMENRVCYLSLEGEKGFAIVRGSKAYTVEFTCRGGRIRELLCDCPCPYTCKHAVAAMLQLQETLDLIERHYGSAYSAAGRFAAIEKGTFFTFAIDGKETGSFTL